MKFTQDRTPQNNFVKHKKSKTFLNIYLANYNLMTGKREYYKMQSIHLTKS